MPTLLLLLIAGGIIYFFWNAARSAAERAVELGRNACRAPRGEPGTRRSHAAACCAQPRASGQSLDQPKT